MFGFFPFQINSYVPDIKIIIVTGDRGVLNNLVELTLRFHWEKIFEDGKEILLV